MQQCSDIEKWQGSKVAISELVEWKREENKSWEHLGIHMGPGQGLLLLLFVF